MKQFLKKIRYIILVLILLMVNFAVPENQSVEAKTLRDLKEELATYEKDLADSENKQKLTEQQISNKKGNIDAINTEIQSIQKEMVSLTVIF